MLKESVVLWGFEPYTLLPQTYPQECHHDVQLIVRFFFFLHEGDTVSCYR